MSDRRILKLKEVIETHCIQHYDEAIQMNVEQSKYYCSLRNVTLHPEYAELIGELLRPALWYSEAEAVGGMATGAIPLVTAVSLEAWRTSHLIKGFFVRNEPKNHGAPEESLLSASFTENGSLLQKGRKVALLEDTMTTGTSTAEVMSLVESLGCQVVLVHTIVERHERGGDQFRRRGIPFGRIFFTDERGNLFVDEEFERSLV